MLKSRIDEKIKEVGLRRDYVQSHMNISKQQLSNWCRGRSYPRAEDLFKLARLLNCKVDDLYEWAEESKE